MKNYFSQFIDNLEKERRSIDERCSLGAEIKPPTSDDVPSPFIDNYIIARLAIYDSVRMAPRIIELNANDCDEFINLLATKTYQSAKEMGGNMPYTVLREVIENLIHAYFSEVVISVLDNGNTIRISDQGPGIKNKEKAFEPGFSTATTLMKKIIKGVGSGLPITKEALSFLGGVVSVEDNLDKGTVFTLSVPINDDYKKEQDYKVLQSSFKLNKRQKQVLSIIMEFGSVGPSKIATELGISLSTAYRDLVYLEETSLISSDEQGKRVLTSIGIEFLDDIFKS